MKPSHQLWDQGPFQADQLRSGDPYELSNGHSIAREPAGRRHGRRNLVGAVVLASDPAVEEVGIDVGFALDELTLRAPDVAIGNLADEAGFATGAPTLALEYAEENTNDANLGRKIAELLAAGTQVVWVVRLGGERQVEVHRRGAPPAVYRRGDSLTAPGILQNPVPVDALYDYRVACEVAFRNELQRKGYGSLDAIRDRGHAQGLAEGMALVNAQARTALRHVLAARGLALTAAHQALIDACTDVTTLNRWLQVAAIATTANDVFGGANQS